MMSRYYNIFSLLFLAVTQWNIQIVLSDSRKRNITNINVIHIQPNDDNIHVIPYPESYSNKDISKFQMKRQQTDSCLSNKKSLDMLSSADFIHLQLSFVYMLESELGWEPTRDLYYFEDALLKELERRLMICDDDSRVEVKDDHERKSDFASYIISMDSSPDDYILSNGFCIPSIQNATCQVIQGSMSLWVKNELELNQMSILPNVTLEFFSSVKDIVNNSTFVSSINPHLFQGRYVSSSTMDFDTTLKDLRLMTPKKIVVGPAVTIVSTGSISILCLLCFVVCQKKRNKTNTTHKSTDCDDILIEKEDHEVSSTTISPWNQTSFYCSSDGEDGWIDDVAINHSNLNLNSSLFLVKSPINETTWNSSTSLSGMKSIVGGPLDIIDEEQPCQCLEETDEDCIDYSELEQARGILFDI